jgi:cytochrome c biogenesis protein CcmG, thiol:disulfide interchange protein DsbE
MIDRRSIASAVTVLALSMTACGGGDGDDAGGTSATTADPSADPSADATVDAASTATSTAASAGDGPTATVSPDVPEEIRGELRPLDAVGDTLPQLGRAQPEADPAVGMAAPVLVGQDYDGNTVRVDAATDGPTMVVFLAHWCPHCNAEVPRINELRDAGRFPADLNIVAVSTAIDPGRPNFPPSAWVVEKDWTYPVIADNVDMGAQSFIGASVYGVDGFPFVTLIDADGNVAARWSGEREPDQVIDAIGRYLGL